MKNAYVLLIVEIGSEQKVLNVLDKIPDVKEAYQLHGIYDLIISVEAETMQMIKDVIVLKIRNIGEVKSTLSLICIN